MGKARVPLFGAGQQRVVTIDPDATHGATIGANVFNADGTLYDPTAPAAAQQEPLAAGTSLDDIAGEVSTASSSAAAANEQLAAIASDNTLSPAEKPTVMRDYSVITAEQAGIDAQAVQYLAAASAEQVAYDNAITALTAYLDTLSDPTAWNDKSGNTTIDGPTFRANFNSVYTTRQTLLNAIYAKAKALADAAQTTGTNAQNTATLTATGGFHSETVDNATFSLPLNADGSVPGWTPFQGSGGTLGYLASAHFNNANILWITGQATGAQSTRKYACKPGDFVSAWADMYSGESAGAGLLQIRFYDAADNLLSPQANASNSAAATWQTLNAAGIAPANTAYFRLLIYNGATGSAQHVGANNVRVSVNDVRVHNSGIQLGDQRNLPSSITRGFGLIRSATALTAFSTGAVNVNAHTITMGAASVPYNAHTSAVTGLTVGQAYYIYTRDNYAGGSPTFASSQNSATLNGYDDAYVAGQVTIPSSGSTGGGGTGVCVAASMYLRQGVTGYDLVRRWRWWHTLLPPKLDCVDGKARRLRRKPRIVRNAGCLITLENGHAVECSVDTPVDTRDGSSVLAPWLHGHLIASDDGWQRVMDVQLGGQIDVVRLCVGGHAFYAGTHWLRRVGTHNSFKN